MNLLALMRLPPDNMAASLALLAGLVVACEYLRISLMVTRLRSIAVHLLCGALTVVIQPAFLAVALVLGIADHPDRAWLNMGVVALLYLVWYIAGQSTLLVRRDAQGADVGFMTVGALFTFGAGLVATWVY